VNTDMSGRLSLRNALQTTALITLLALAPWAAMAQPPAAAGIDWRASQVSLADLELSTPAGVRGARDRLHQVARQLCSQLPDSQNPSRQANFIACMNDTLADALRQLNGPMRAVIVASGEWRTQSTDVARGHSRPTAPETSVTVVSLAKLDLSTPHDVRIAHGRIEDAARRVCVRLLSDLVRWEELNYLKCVRDATAGALQQVRGPTVAAIDELRAAY
jgi:UrcA family protein